MVNAPIMQEAGETKQPVLVKDFLGNLMKEPALGEIEETNEGRAWQRNKLMSMLDGAITPDVRRAVADKLTELDVYESNQRGIINPTLEPTFEEALGGAKTNTGIDIYSLSEMAKAAPAAAKLSYNKQLKAISNQQKKDSGYIEFNGNYYDPAQMPSGFGWSAAMNSLDFDYFAGQEEEEVVPLLNSKFGQYGFSFSQSGTVTDNVTITAPSGETLEVSLDNFTDAGDRESSFAIQSFLNDQYAQQELSDEDVISTALEMPSQLSKTGIGTEYAYDVIEYNNGYDSRRIKAIENENKAAVELNDYVLTQKADIEQTQKSIEELKPLISADPTNQELRAKYEVLNTQLNTSAKNFNSAVVGLTEAVTDIDNMQSEFTRVAGARAAAAVDWDLSNLPEMFVGEFARGTSEVLRGFIDIGGDVANMYNYLHQAIEGEALFTDQQLKDWKKVNKTPLKYAGELASGMLFSGNLDVGQLVESGQVTINDKTGKLEVGGGMVSEETVAKFNELGWVAQGLTGVTRSLPAMLTGPARIAAFYGMGVENLDEQMNNNPKFANMTEAEKLYLKIPLGVVVGVLEEFGMRNVLGNSSFVSKVALKALTAFGKKPVAQQTSRTFRETIKKTIKNSVGGKILKGAILTGSAGAAEFETGYLQEIADIYGKEIFDLAQGVDYFDNVVSLSKDGKFSLDKAFDSAVHDQALHAGLAEMVGGVVMGLPGAISESGQSVEFENITDPQWAIFKEITESENVEEYINLQRGALEAAIGLVPSPYAKKGEERMLSKEDVDTAMRDYGKIAALSNTVRKEYAPSYQKKILKLVMTRNEIQENIKDLDKATTKEQQRQVSILNEDIAEITREADKELAESTREYDRLKSEGKTTKDFNSWRTQKVFKDALESVTESRTEEEVSPTTPVEEDVSTKTAEEQEAQLLGQELEAEGVSRPATQEQVTEEVVEEAPVLEEAQSVLDEVWNNEMQENRDAQLEAAEKQLKEEKGPGRRRMLFGQRQAPVITQEEILQRAKENLNEQNISLQEQEVSPTTPVQEVSLVANPTRSQEKQGNVYTIQQDGKEVGEVMFTQNSKGEIVVQDVDVSSANQKQGIATKAYQAINKMVGDKKVVSSTMFVEEGGVKPGEKLWESLVRNNLAKKTDTGFEMIKQTTDEVPQFRTKDEAKAQEEVSEDTEADVQNIVEKINEMESGNVSTNLDTTAEGVTINTQELNERTDRELPTITNLQIIDGIPTIFTISDQLRTGDIVNPQTGNTIDNLRGGLGFTGTSGNENAAWANTTDKEAVDIFNKAVKTYEQNKEVFEEWWKANPEFAGHIPMSVVKMGEGSILSNEATFRVLRDNLTKIPLKNRKNAVKFLKQSIKDKIAAKEKSIKTGINDKGEKLKPLTIKNYQKEVKGHKDALKTLDKLNPKIIDEVVSQEFIETLSLPARRTLIEQITFGQPNRAGESKAPSKSDKAVPAALIEGMPKEALELVHLGIITDLITEPQLKNVPQRNIIALQAIEIGKFNPQTNELVEITLDEAIIDTKHPNYPVGTKGKTIGILENPVSVVKAYPQAYANAMSGLVAEEQKGRRMSKSAYKKLSKKDRETAPKPGELLGASVGTVLTQKLGVQNGLPNAEFIGAIAQQNITKEQQLIAFMNQSFPGVVISTDQETFDNVMNSEGINKKFVEGKVVYGVTKDGDIYINPEVHNTQSEIFNTAIHEMGHVWQTFLLTTPKGTKIYNRGVQLVKQTAEYKRQLEIFEGNEEKAAHEAMAILIGNKGESIAEAATRSKFQEWMVGMWKFIKSSFKMSKDVKVSELQDMNLDDFLGTALADIFSGKPVRGPKARYLTKLKNPEAAFSAEQDMTQVIIYGRNNGFSDAAIKIHLQSKGFTVSEIKDALEINRDLFDNTFPPAFANVPGGVNEGMKMYERTLKKIKAFKRNQNPSLKEIQEQAQLFLKRDKTFKTYNETLQQNLLIALNASLNINESAQVAQDIKKMREVVKQRRKGAKELATLQTQLRVFIRKNFPSTQWESKEVNQLINEITNAKFYKDFENLAVKPDNDIRMVMDKVSKIVMQKRVTDAVKKINKQLSIKTQKTEGGRKKGVNFLPEAVERIEKIAEDLAIDVVNYNEIDRLQARLVTAVRNNNKEDIEKIELKLSKLKADADFISEKIESLRVEFSKLQEKNEFSDEDATRMQDIEIAILYNEALLMENDNPTKADTLVNVQNLLNNLLTLERESYNEVIRQAKERYNRLKSEFLEDVSGVKVDYNDKKSVAEGKRKVRERKNMKDRNVLGKILNVILKPTSMIFKRTESVEGLVSRISKGQGEMFGGKSSELIIDRLNESRRDYRKGQKQKLTRLKMKAEEIFGKNFLKVSEKNQRKNVEIILDQGRYNSLNKKLKESKSKSEKRKLQREIDGLVERYSQNEMYYLYNQYKDSANHPGFASTFEGYDHKKIMAQITSKLDSKVKEWADWQVNEFFPSVYNQYNEVYKKIYRTNMPWNKNYAGRLVRDERQEQVQDVMSIQNAYRASVGSQSTMMRIKNKAPIKIVSGDNILSQYVDEMEYFSAYGENMRDISKMYSDPLVKKAIETFTDADVYKVLQGQLEKIIQRRNARLTPDHPVFTAATSAFAISKLGLNPVVAVKQMTSSLAFADYIGYRNWSLYFLKETKNGVAKYNTTWQEMYDNSPELQNRYERDDFQQIIETYAKEQSQDILGGKTVLGTSKTDFNKVRNFFMYLVKVGDMAGVMGSIPNYAYYKDEYKKKNPTATEQEAIDFAIKKTTPQILSTQQSSDIQDKDHYSTDSALMRSFQLFTSSPRALMRKEVYSIRELHRKLMVLARTMDPKVAAQSGKGSVKDNLRTFITYHFVVPTFFKYVALGLPGLAQDWEDDDTEQLRGFKSLLLGNIQSIFIVGDIITGLNDAFEEKPWAGKLRNVPLFQEVSGVLQNYSKYNKSTTPETKEKYAEKMRYGIFSLLGIPYKQYDTALENYGDIATGDFKGYGDLMLKLLNYSKYVREGGADKKESTSSEGDSKKKKTKKIGDKLF